MNFGKIFIRTFYISQNVKQFVPVTGLWGEFIDESHEKQEILIYCDDRYNGDMNRIQWELEDWEAPKSTWN